MDCRCVFLCSPSTAHEMRISGWISNLCSSDLPDLARHVWIFFHHYGRSLDGIALRLGISRRRAKRLRERAEYAIHGEPYPSLAFHIRFALMRKRLSLAWRWKIIRSAFYD